MDPISAVGTFTTVFKMMSIAPSAYQKLNEWRGKPSKKEREALKRYCRRLDERRVFSAPFNSEVVECCVASVSQVKEYTDETLANLDHPATRAVLGAIMDVLRGFLDEWHGRRTPPDPFGWASRGGRNEIGAFYEDLGELRSKMKMLIGLISELEPAATCPKLLAAKSSDAR
jgi:hypothetical protein